jgi:hypothetical protein
MTSNRIKHAGTVETFAFRFWTSRRIIDGHIERKTFGAMASDMITQENAPKENPVNCGKRGIGMRKSQWRMIVAHRREAKQTDVPILNSVAPRALRGSDGLNDELRLLPPDLNFSTV